MFRVHGPLFGTLYIQTVSFNLVEIGKLLGKRNINLYIASQGLYIASNDLYIASNDLYIASGYENSQTESAK